MEYLFLLAMGFIASAYGIMVGAGGGFILVPILLLLFQIEPAEAVGTGLALVFLNSISGLYSYMKQKRVLVKTGLWLAMGAVPGTLIGNIIVRIVSEQLFYYIFAVMLIGLGIFLMIKIPSEHMRFSNRKIAEQHLLSSVSRVIKIVLIGVMLGGVSAFFGIGGGWLLVPILVYLFRISPYFATATSIFSLAIYSFAGTLLPLVQGDINGTILFWSGIGIIFGSQTGAWLSMKVSNLALVRMLAALVILIGGSMFWK